MRLRVRVEHLLMLTVAFIVIGASVWKYKHVILSNKGSTTEMRIAVFAVVSGISLLLTWLFRSKSEAWINAVQNRITPLVWIFGTVVVLSVSLVAYKTLAPDNRSANIQKPVPAFTDNQERPNIILLTFDTLTTENMSLYGYDRTTDPFIREWSKTASVFKRVKAGSNWTTPSLASLFTGKRVWTHQAFHLQGSKAVKGDIENLAFILKNSGYYNMAFVANPRASVQTLGINNSFHYAPLPSEFTAPASFLTFLDKALLQFFGDKIRLYDWIVKEDFILDRILRGVSGDISKTVVPPEKVFKSFFMSMDNNHESPFFAWIHLFPPHDPYLPPEPYSGYFDPTSEFKTMRSQKKGVEMIKNATRIQDIKHSFPENVHVVVDSLRNRYDEFIRYCDKQFQDFITELGKRDAIKNTIIILSSDHGESFEHGYILHNGPHLYEELTSIPLIIKEASQVKGRTIHDTVDITDYAPTILDFVHVPIPQWMEGRSLMPMLRGAEMKPAPVFSMNLESNEGRGVPITKGTVAVWEGKHKLIHYLDKNISLLFNLENDPDELNNLYGSESGVARHLLGLIRENLKKANEKISLGE
jgi:arylsulfatase A-like enzyme